MPKKSKPHVRPCFEKGLCGQFMKCPNPTKCVLSPFFESEIHMRCPDAKPKPFRYEKMLREMKQGRDFDRRGHPMTFYRWMAEKGRQIKPVEEKKDEKEKQMESKKRNPTLLDY